MSIFVSTGAAFAGALAADLDSGFLLVVTETFDCTLADLVAAMDEFFPAVLALGASTVALDAFALFAFNSLLFAAGFFAEVLAPLADAPLVADAFILLESVFVVVASDRNDDAADFSPAVFVSFAGSIKGFAGFFIAFAKVSTTE